MESNGTTQYLYGSLSNPFQVTASRAPDNTLTVYYYEDFGALYALERGGVRYYVGSDHLGTPKVIADNTGNIVRQMEYDSWGVKTGDTNPGFDLPVGFAGGIPDDATGLVRFGFRDYEPGTGRWTAKDPVFFRGGLNLFQYAGNNPVNIIDRSGLLASCWHRSITWRAAIAVGMSESDAWLLADAVAAVDTYESLIRSDAAMANQHGMAGELSPGEWQTQEQAINGTNQFIQAAFASGNIAGALHAAQDLTTPGHAGNRYEGVGEGGLTASHIYGDYYPTAATINNAYNATLRLLLRR